MKKCESCGGTGLIAVCSCERGTSSSCIATGAVGNHDYCNQYCGCDLGGNPAFIAEQEESK